ncbi:toll/interleukin-1 receptor domain-containing protein [Enterococcus sp. SMC-9]|uniref:toll/interleukin-1 receptor domain-containing protein n=1 Tax=Enterococcus sp. SMC-9 TaxID=2862343 RepID=UPI001E300DF2|nr:toll/interleukin-1 receptor domain-containing protein [Enterococcus sp. SMC-9]MCD1023986.1 toll/interleukin-1 receptor domain-containing protein [Enterococcus sp. SMC-9]
MYKGYNLDLSVIEKQSFLNVTNYEIDLFEKKIDSKKNELLSRINETIYLPRTEDNKIDGSQLINDWFPNYKSDIFLSHSHNDHRTAKRLAVWLKREFGLEVFLDSIVWGSADKLLKNIDNEYAILRKKGDNITYNYDIRNFTTSHVHMMLSTALNDVINNTECLIFLNTPESINVGEVSMRKTNSPWIYNELKIASLIEKKNPRETILKEQLGKRQKEIYANGGLDILYDVQTQLGCLETLDNKKIQEWQKEWRISNHKFHPLDLLYYGNSNYFLKKASKK